MRCGVPGTREENPCVMIEGALFLERKCVVIS